MTAANRKRPHSWSIRLSDDELQQVQKRVKKSGRTQRDFALHALLSVPILNINGLNQVLVELRRIGNNINQIAYSCNKGNQTSYDEIIGIRKELGDVWQLLKQLTTARH